MISFKECEFKKEKEMNFILPVAQVNILHTARFGMYKSACMAYVQCYKRDGSLWLTLYNFTDVTAVVKVRQRDVHPAHRPRHIFVMQ